MMESFYTTHHYLLSHLSKHLVRRELMDEINWNDRLIGIKGSRGIGKTTFLLSYAKEFYGIDNRACLYINFNHFFFTQHSLVDFARDFRAQGGKTLLIDQVFKYHEWSKELRLCYDAFPDLKIIFTGPAVMRLKEENPDLAGKVSVYQLRGFSFREYLNLINDKRFPTVTIDDILHHNQDIARDIVGEMQGKLHADFRKYMYHGFYPFFLEKRNFSENLLKTMNMTLEVDVLFLKHIEQRYLPKIRKLFYMIALDAPCTPNVSQLSKELDISRATVMNYIKYLKDARLINLLYPVGEYFPKKPSTVYVYNTNQLHVVNQETLGLDAVYKTFFFNQLLKCASVHQGIKKADFTVDEKHLFCVKAGEIPKNIPPYWYVVNTDIGYSRTIPLWMFGFLY